MLKPDRFSCSQKIWLNRDPPVPNGCIFENTVAPLFQYYVQAAQPVPSTTVQASSMTANKILITYQLTGGSYTGP